METEKMKSIRYQEYYDKVYGGWFGKCLGGAAGAPVEGIKGSVDRSMRELLDPDMPNDDLDLQILWLEVLEKKGPHLTSDDLAGAWLRQCWYPFGEYGYFLKNFESGIHPPLSGSHNNRYFHEGMGCPIRSEIWAMIHPGDPAKAAEMAEKDGRLDHAGNSVWAEIFLSALESMAFFEEDIPALIRGALAFVTEDCRLRRCIAMVLESYERGDGFREIVRSIQVDYSHPDFTNSVQNLGYTVLALLFGEKDIEKTISLALRCGYDADCTCATAGAVVGIIAGYAALPGDIKELLKDKYVIGIDVRRSDDTIATLAADTCRVGLGTGLLTGAVPIMGIPGEIRPARWEQTPSGPEISVRYRKVPAIGFGDTCPVEILVRNPSDKPLRGRYSFRGIPAGWSANPAEGRIEAAPGEEALVRTEFSTSPNLPVLHQKNLLDFVLREDGTGNETSYGFGISGGILWKVTGPFIEPMEFKEKENVPPCHQTESVLPSVETMFSNMAVPDREYIDEALYVRDPSAFAMERSITAYEDLIPVDDHFGIAGEATFYLYTDLVFDRDIRTWVVIGNNDAFMLWINGTLIESFDETRTWQPQCHGSIVEFRKGANRVALKLTRRTGSLKFSIGIRGTDEKHYHQQKWRTDFACAADTDHHR